MEPEEAGMELVMPLVVVTSNGGLYDDAAFVAGMHFQSLWDVLERRPVSYQQFVRTPLVAQIDLLAMHFGYRLEIEPWEPDGDIWTFAKFLRTVV